MSRYSTFLSTVAALALATGATFAQSTTDSDAVSADGDATIDVAANVDANAWAPGWNKDLDSRYGDIADRQIAELLGMNVLSEKGDDVGEVDTFILVENELKAVIGVGGFLGLGEHEVAISLGDMEYNGEALVIAYTEEELRAMPQYMNEFDQAALGIDDTFRTRGRADAEFDPGTPEEISPAGEDVAAAEDASEAAGGDGHTMIEEIAEDQQGEIEQEAEEIVAEASAAIEEGAENPGQMAEHAAETADTWMQKIENEFAEIAEWQINELEGRNIATESGEVIGEVEQLAIQNDNVVALVGIGGFLGLGEHDVALDLASLNWDGDKFIVEGMTEEELKALPEYDATLVTEIDDDATLRTQVTN